MGIQIVPGTGSRRAYDAKYKLTQGPWTGGINTVEASTNLGENELRECVNYTLKPDGSLRLRPPVTRINSDGNSTKGDMFDLTPNHIVTHLGSVIRNSNGDLVPVISVKPLNDIFGRHIYFYYWNGIQWTKAWDTIDNTYGAATVADIGVFTSVVQFNDNYYLLSNGGAISSSGSLTGSLTLETNDTTLIAGVQVRGREAVVLKNRMFIHDGLNLMFSVAADFGNWATGPGAGILKTAGGDNDQIRRMVVFQDAIWLMKNNGVYRFSYSVDPNTDFVYERISEEGAYDAVVYNNELYIINGKGVYKLVSGYFIELSTKIRNTFRQASSHLDYVQFGGAGPALGIGFNKIGLFLVGSQLLCGPFNTMVPLRYNEAYDNYVNNAYFVLDLDSGAWTKWQFSAYSTDNPIAGPSQSPMPFSNSNPAAPESYVWAGLSMPQAGVFLYPYQNEMYSLDAVQLSAYDTDGLDLRGNDYGELGTEWIGGKVVCGAINLGDTTAWKRVFTATLDARWVSTITFLHGSSLIGIVKDGVTANPTIVPSAGRLRFGKAFRCKRFALYYDSISGIDTDRALNQLPELTDINMFTSVVQVSRMVSDAVSN